MTDASSFGIVTKYATSGQYEWAFWVDGSDKLVFRLTENTDIGDYSQIKSDATLTAYEGQWVHVAASYAGAGPTASSGNDFPAAASGMALYINGSAIAATGSNVDYPGMTAGSDPVVIGKILGSFSEGSIRDVKIFNRELTASEVAELARGNDLGFSEEWAGAHGGLYSQDSSPSGEWTGVAATDADEAGPIGGVSNVLSLTVSGTGSAVHYATLNSSLSLSVGKRIRVSGKVFIPSTNSNADGFRIYLAGGDVFADLTSPTLDTWVPFSGEGLHGSGSYVIAMMDGGVLAFADAGGDDVIYLADIKITAVGNLASFSAERYDTSTSKLYDISDNAFVGTGTSVTLTGREVPVYETGTWTPTITFGGGSTGIAYGAQEGYYTRVGNTVHITCVISLTSKGSDTGSAVVEGLPFTSRNTSGSAQTIGPVLATTMASLGSVPCAVAGDATSNAQLFDSSASGFSFLDDTNFNNTSAIRFSGTYQIQ